MNDGLFDVLIAGGGPAALQAALTLGRARKRVLVADGGPRRNAPAGHMYLNVSFRDEQIDTITGLRGDFRAGAVRARRVLLATGLIDQPPELENLAPLWGHSVFQCPDCHGWQGRERVAVAFKPHFGVPGVRSTRRSFRSRSGPEPRPNIIEIFCAIIASAEATGHSKRSPLDRL